MSEETATPDLVALTQAMGAAAGVEETMAFFADDPVWDGSPLGLEIYRGRDAIRRSLKEWVEIYDDIDDEDEDIVEIGHGVVFSATRLSGRSRAGAAGGQISGCYGFVYTWIDGKIAHVTVYPDIGEARVAAERLANERG
jgi:ketosteroid isomerase-like protein